MLQPTGKTTETQMDGKGVYTIRVRYTVMVRLRLRANF